MIAMEWETVIGLEIHAQLKTASKIFSGASTKYGASPNSQASLVDLGYPGVLPVLNAACVQMAVKFGLATLSASVLLAFGALVLGLRLHATPASLVAFAGSLVLGSLGIVGVGLVLAGCAMVFARQSMMMNEGVSAILYLMCGVVFPPDFLPRALQPVAWALPMTWWLEASRRALGATNFSPAPRK